MMVRRVLMVLAVSAVLVASLAGAVAAQANGGITTESVRSAQIRR